MATDKESTRKMIDIMVDYRKGLYNIKTASAALQNATGLNHDNCVTLLKNTKRNNVTQIRGYSNEPERLLQGKKGKANEAQK